MKTILYNPIFINPQAYYVFPRLTRYLQPDNESTAEPANYIGTIEVKVIAYGDTTLKRTYTNTDSIDLSEFKNTWIRISLFTKVGSCVLGEWKIGNMESDLPYIDPEVLASLKAVVIVGNKTNNDSDRAIVKNLVDPDNPFIISNAAFKLNSGFGKYEITFQYFPYIENVTNVSDSKVVFGIGGQLLIPYSAITENIPSFKIKVNGLSGTYHFRYYYRSSDGVQHSVNMAQDGYYELPICYNVQSSSDGTHCGFANNGYDVVTITQIPSFEGAFVTDGIDDLITSTKTVQEMGITDEVTVVGMIHQIDKPSNFITTNNIRTSGSVVGRNAISLTDKTGIYGWYKDNIQGSTINVINNILGDKADYTASASSNTNLSSKFSVVGYISNDSIIETSQVAWYWTIIANKVLTTDQINQVIAYFNLDRTLKPDILCNTIKQGITNENHAEFGDKLIDFSGNGRDIQLNNLAWKGGSGIAAKQYETFKDWTNTPYQTSTVTEIDEFTRVVDSTSNAYWVSMINRTSDFDKVHDSINIVLYQDDMLLVHECKYKIDENVTTKALYETLKSGVNTITLATIDKFTDIPEDAEIMSLGEWVNPKSNKGSVKITLLPSYKGGLLLDGVNDFGKVTGMPVYKDYTVVTDREIFANIGAISSKNNPGAFVETAGNSVYSFGQATSGLNFISTRSISYLSKYSYCGQSITAGAAEDGTDMWLGTIRDNDSRFFNGAIYSLMSFPYSMSEFLIERQLKKHKLGTLYPDMVEFRPVIKANANYKITYYQIDSTNTWKSIKVGDYIVIGAKLAFQITFDNDASELKEVVSPQLSGIIVEKRPSNSGYNIYSYITSKSPQKINITIDEYIRFEDIVQPYPVLLRFKDENGNEVSWGGKFKVGSTITRIGSIADPESNLLNGLYSISGLSLNGKAVTSSTSIVEKQMVFRTTATWLLDNNEPKCILSPRLLRIPNSSYKILGHIPDISGHGNNGIINNSAYAEGSGVNEDDSYQFDGVDDFVTIPTLSSGGKQVLMKINWQSGNGDVLYDQRTSTEGLFAITAASETIAYNYRNAGGNTYIDGVLNKHILSEELASITHNIILNNDYTVTNSNIFIGTNYANTVYAKMSLYDFMLFDEISTDDKIKELNEYVGVEAKVELPPYYWDTYGKTNSDADRDIIQQRGVAIGDYDLTNYNHTYEGMSGYNGYPVVFGANKTWANESNGYVTSITSNTIHITNVLNAGLALLYSYVKYNGNLQNIKEIPPFKIEIKGLEGRSKFIYKYLATSDATKETNLYLENGTHELPKSFLPTEALINNAVVGFSISPIEEGVTNFLSDITIKVLPEYENGLAYDGVEDYSENVNIPIVDDFTFLVKASLLKGFTGSGGLIARKGDVKHVTSGGYAFVYCLDSSSNEANRNSYYSFGKALLPSTGAIDPPLIGYMTKTSVNGVATTFGTNPDIKGINFGDWNGGRMSMVVYKSMLYPKTIPLLQINFLKNLMEKDEIIDLTNPIFIQE